MAVCHTFLQMARKIIFAGTPDIAVPSLLSLAEHPDIEIMGVICPPDKKIGRKQILTPCAVKKTALTLNLPVFEAENKKDILTTYKKIQPELVVVIALGVIFPKEALDISPTINVHFSLLPKWRGASPVQSALLAGEKFSGITIQKMVPKLDAGDILHQQSETIENYGTRDLWERWSHTSANILPQLVQTFETITALPQDNSLATHCGKFEKSDGEIFPERETAEIIMQKYRAFDVWPGIFLTTNDTTIKILTCSLHETENSVPLSCKDKTTLWVEEIQLSGKSAASAKDVLRGRPDLFLR